MNAVFDWLRSFLAARSARERWILLAAVSVVGFVMVHTIVIRPMSNRVGPARSEVQELESEFAQALRMAGDVRLLQAELSSVEGRIGTGEATNLFALLEKLAAEAQVKDQLESIKPKQPSGNVDYPETRVEVQLKGATLGQAVHFLHRIETAPMHLIVRSIRMRSRPDGSKLLDVSFSVSSFVRS